MVYWFWIWLNVTWKFVVNFHVKLFLVNVRFSQIKIFWCPGRGEQTCHVLALLSWIFLWEVCLATAVLVKRPESSICSLPSGSSFTTFRKQRSWKWELTQETEASTKTWTRGPILRDLQTVLDFTTTKIFQQQSCSHLVPSKRCWGCPWTILSKNMHQRRCLCDSAIFVIDLFQWSTHDWQSPTFKSAESGLRAPPCKGGTERTALDKKILWKGNRLSFAKINQGPRTRQGSPQRG